MPELLFYLISFTSRAPFGQLDVEVVASDGLAAPAPVPCAAVTMLEMQTKMGELAQSYYDQNTVAAVCADKLGVPVTAGLVP